MAAACEVVGIAVSRAKIREWLEQLEGYSLIKVDYKRDRETRVTLSINSKDV
jgi:DNA-binding GntR family transcriptional regulator